MKVKALNDVRYMFEHVYLKDMFFAYEKEFITRILSRQEKGYDLVYELYTDFCEKRNTHNPFTRDEFYTSIHKIEDDLNLIIVTLPKPQKTLRCYYIMITYDDALEKLMYFTVEKSVVEDGLPRLCRWEKEEHVNIAEMELVVKDIVSKVVEVYKEK